MAETGQYHAYTIIGDTAKKLARVSLRVDLTDAQAYVAAANEAARAATKVGLLLLAVENLQLLGATNNIYGRGLDYGFLELPFAYPTTLENVYRSNKLKVDLATTNAGLPATNFFTIPAYDPAEITKESNGVNVVLSGPGVSPEISNLITQLADTWLSIYNTPGAVVEITINDE